MVVRRAFGSDDLSESHVETATDGASGLQRSCGRRARRVFPSTGNGVSPDSRVASVNQIRWASVMYLLTGLSQVIAVPFTVAHIAREREHPLVFPGVRGLAGPFDALGIDAVVMLGVLFIALGAIELLIAALLWRMRKLGAVLAFVLFLPGLFFWVGFALPGWLLVGPLRVVLVARGWKSLR